MLQIDFIYANINDRPNKCILVFGAHADDVEYAGGTLAKYCAEGYEGIYVGAINNLAGCNLERTPYYQDGPNFTFSNSPYKYPIGALETSQIREEEAKQAAAVYPATPIFLNYVEPWFSMGRKQIDVGTEQFYQYAPPGRPIISIASHLDEEVELVYNLLKKYQPEIVIIHTLGGEKHDHGNSAYLMYLAFQKALDNNIPVGKLWMTVNGWFSTEYAQNNGRGKPDVLIDVRDYLPIKYEALSKHVSQNGGFGKEHARKRQHDEEFEKFITVIDNIK